MNGLNGLVINLMSFDSYRFDGTVTLLHYLWKGPIEVAVFGYFLYLEIGFYGWIGVGFILCFVPIQGEWYPKFHLYDKGSYWFFQLNAIKYSHFSLHG